MPSYFLETDLESDDLLAIYILARRGYYPTYVVVGEGNAETKWHRMMNYIQLLRTENLMPKDSSTMVICGHNSKKPFPADGQEFKPEELKQFNDIPDYKVHYVLAMKDYVKSTHDPIYVGLKPPRELLEFSSQLTNEISQMRGFMYGSFNFRSVWDQMKELAQLLGQFKSMHLYESYPATGNQNSMTTKWCPQTWKSLREHKSPFIQHINRLVVLWNTHMNTNCAQTCMELMKKYGLAATSFNFETESLDTVREIVTKAGMNAEDSDKFMRNISVYRVIRDNIDSQIVMADIGVALVLDEPQFDLYIKRGDISFSESGYTQLAENPNSSIRLYMNMPVDKYDVTILSHL